MKNFGIRLKQALAKQNMTQLKLAELLDISPQSIQKWLGGLASPSNDNVLKISGILDISPAWLLFGLDGQEGYFIEIPETRVEFSAGNGAVYHTVDDDSGSKASYRMEWFTRERMNPNHCIRVKVKGDSMEPLLFNGDVVLINLDETEITDGCVYAVRWENSLYIKRLAMLPSVGIKFMSENPIYDTIVISSDEVDEQVQILGRVRDKSGRGGL